MSAFLLDCSHTLDKQPMTRFVFLRAMSLFFVLILVAACDTSGDNVTRITIEPTRIGAGAPVFTPTLTYTPSNTPTTTATWTITPTPTITPEPSVTPTNTPTPSDTPTPTNTFTPSPSQTRTPTPTATVVLQPPSQNNVSNAPAEAIIAPADFSGDVGWSCGDFPCEDDIDGFLQRIRVPQGFAVDFVGQFDGQVQQITYGNDGRLYATVLENGTLTGAVYAMNDDGSTERYSETLVSPLGLAFQPNTDDLYVTSRLTLESGGLLWRIRSNGDYEIVLDDLPCCYQAVGNQPNGIVFGNDGLLYIGVGALTDHAESPNPDSQAFAELQPNEAAILRVNPHTGDVGVRATGIRNPYDIAVDSRGRMFASDKGLVTGEGDRLLEVEIGANYSFPYYRNRGCRDCPPTRGNTDFAPDLLTLPNYTLPHGLTVYNGAQFPANMQDTLLVALWNANRVIWVDPDDIAISTEEYQPQAFVTGLIRPTDVIVAPDGSVVIADYVYGHIWRVTYTGNGDASTGSFALPTRDIDTSEANTTETPNAPVLFVTSTPEN